MRMKNALVIGMARSGIACAKLLNKQGVHVIINDTKPLEKFSGDLDELKIDGIEFSLGQDPIPLIDNVDIVIISPGVPDTAPVVIESRKRGIKLVGEMEYAYTSSKGTLLAITGTNGKTTTTTLLSEILTATSKTVHTVGNIGNPYSAEAFDATDDDYSVCEVSSFQLETIEKFHPSVCAVLNITEDHLNRHGTMEKYIELKKRVFENCVDDDCVVLNYDDAITRKMACDVKSRVVWFSAESSVPFGAFTVNGEIVFGSKNSYTPIAPVSELQIIGKHNLSNALAAVSMAMCVGVSPDVIRQTLAAFKSVEHRIEFTREVSGIRFYNDSKGTNVDSTIQAIRAMDRKTVLIAGGYDKHADFMPMVDEILKSNINHIVLIGATADQIAKCLNERDFSAYEMCGFDFNYAISRAYDICASGGNVLLSPACASFDMFSDYEARGREFKRIVKDLEPKVN